MLTKAHFLESLAHETSILKHLHGKLTPAQADFRPRDNMRTLLDLLRYLARCATTATHGVLRGWNVGHLLEEASSMEFEEFPAWLDRQTREVADLLAEIPDEDFLTRRAQVPWKEEMPLGRALVETTLKFTTGYRMQLFLYAKETGLEIGTANCWAGMDVPARKA